MTEQEKVKWKAPPDFTDFTISSSVRVVEKAGKAVGIEVSWSETR